MIEGADSQQVRDIDFSSGAMYMVASGGDDGSVKWWDYRHCAAPLHEQPDVHSHWVWQVQFSPNYGDRLLLSAGTDAIVNLWDVAQRNEEESALIKTYDEHEDSIYSVAWSAADPWVFASLSFDGRAVLCTVPQDVQMSILMASSEPVE